LGPCYWAYKMPEWSGVLDWTLNVIEKLVSA